MHGQARKLGLSLSMASSQRVDSVPGPRMVAFLKEKFSIVSCQLGPRAQEAFAQAELVADAGGFSLGRALTNNSYPKEGTQLHLSDSMFSGLQVRRGLKLETSWSDVKPLGQMSEKPDGSLFQYYLLQKKAPVSWPPTESQVSGVFLDTLAFLKFNTKSSNEVNQAGGVEAGGDEAGGGSAGGNLVLFDSAVHAAIICRMFTQGLLGRKCSMIKIRMPPPVAGGASQFNLKVTVVEHSQSLCSYTVVSGAAKDIANFMSSAQDVQSISVSLMFKKANARPEDEEDSPLDMVSACKEAASSQCLGFAHGVV